MIKNTDLVEAFGSMKHGQFNIHFLEKFIREYVGLSLNVKKLQIKPNSMPSIWGGLKCKQYPQELAGLLVFLYQHIDEIRSYCEIGVERGGTFFVIDSFLRTFHPRMPSIAVDISNKILHCGWEEYNRRYPYAEFWQGKSRDLGFKNHDFCFIDGDHSLEGARQDYLAFKDCKYIAMHDVLCPFLDVRLAWEQVPEPRLVIQNRDEAFPVPLGIGVAW